MSLKESQKKHYRKLLDELESLLHLSREKYLTLTSEDVTKGDGYIKDLDKMKLIALYNQAEQQRKFTWWFICLTVANLVVLAFTAYLTVKFR